MALNGRQIDLRTDLSRLKAGVTMGTHFHERLRVITRPLLEVSTLREAAEPREGRNGRDSEEGSKKSWKDVATDVPPVDICHDLCRLLFCVHRLEILSDPGDEMVLEGAFDDLV
jgi:hypothetical protein